MNIDGKRYHAIWREPGKPHVVKVIDQRYLPWKFVVEDLKTVEQFVSAISEMHVRGAPLIGAVGAFGVYIAIVSAQNCERFDEVVSDAVVALASARPTAINLKWAIDKVVVSIEKGSTPIEKMALAENACEAILAAELKRSKAIGNHGLALIEQLSRKKCGEPVQVLTHCNAGWLACIDYGTATAPMYMAHDSNIPIHVWVDETRPWNQGSRLTAWELGTHGVSHTVITDNAGGLLMSKGQVDVVIVGTDRTTRNGDVANKIGTYLKALAAKANNIPFYVALPSSTIDWTLDSGVDIPIEKRSPDEVHYAVGYDGEKFCRLRITPEFSKAANYSFDITPAELVTGFITERGVCGASEEELFQLFPERDSVR